MRAQTPHILLEDMVDFARGLLSGAEADALRGHVVSCASCSAQMARIERLLALAGADTSEEVPPELVARAVRLIRQRRAALAPPPRRLALATLRFDSAQAPLALGRRGGPGAARQLVFAGEQQDVDVRIKPSGAGWVVWGQLLGAVADGQAELAGPVRVQATLNPLGEFSLPPVPEGAYTLLLQLQDVEISMALEIGE